MSQLLNVSTNPHVLANVTTKSLMRDVILALLPATIWGVIQFGPYALLLIILSIASCVATEYLWNRGFHKEQTIGDLSAVVTGLLLALNLPSGVPFWMPILGGVFAILVVKCLFGGLGQNFMNPALAARCFLLISFSGIMTQFPQPRFGAASTADGVSSATPLAAIKTAETLGASGQSLKNMFLGLSAGTIGEISALLLILGGIYLIARKVITWDIPVIYIATVAVFVFLFGQHHFDLTYVMMELCGGGLMLGAFFMATDYVTSPITPKGRVIYAIAIGVLTGVFRICGNSAEGVSYAIILGNVLTPLIERVTIPKAFGREGKKK